ncbi:MAG: N-acetylmuramoyl-L-alanine amidase family protein, partial [Sciscionella sp.]
AGSAMSQPPEHRRPRVKPKGLARLTAIVLVVALAFVAWFTSRDPATPAAQADPVASSHNHTGDLSQPDPATAPTSSGPTSSGPTTQQPVLRAHQLRVPYLHVPLSPGACMLLPPTHGNRHEVVALDPGHGGLDPGSVARLPGRKPLEEKTVTLPVAKDTAAILRAHGITVVMTRTRDTNSVVLPAKDRDGTLMRPAGVHLDVYARVLCANAAHANAFVSIHFNLYSDPSVGGCNTHYDSTRPFGAQNKRLAVMVQQSLTHALSAAGAPVPNRGIVNWNQNNAEATSPEGDAYGHLLVLGPRKAGYNDHPTSMPGVLIEPMFISNPHEATLATTPATQHVMAAGLASALETFLAHSRH